MKKILLTLTVFCAVLLAVSVNGFIDVAVNGSNPAAPPSGKGRVYVNSSNQLACLNPDSSSCLSHPSIFKDTQTTSGFTRSLNTVFQNTTSLPLFVEVNTNDLGGGSDVVAMADALNPPISVVGEVSPVSMGSAALFFIVLPGNFYEILYDGSLGTWSEWSQ